MFSERDALVCFSAVPSIGRAALRRLLAFDGGMGKLGWLWRSPSKTTNIFTNKQIENLNKFKEKFAGDEYLSYLKQKNIRVVTILDNNYPKLLDKIDDKPLVLYIKGQDLQTNCPLVSVVGSRHATYYGQMATKKIVTELVAGGVGIVSGFMYGIDYCAHQAAVEQNANTIGILGFGFDHFYPSVFLSRYQEMLGKMTFISEYPPFMRPVRGSFPERNRIVAGLSLGTVVVEAGEKSGTMITAGLAGEYGRGVFAVPGSIFSPYSSGTRQLINQGACLVSTGTQVLEELGFVLANKASEEVFHFETLASKIAATSSKIIYLLKGGTMSFEDLLAETKLGVVELTQKLIELEIEGLVICSGANWSLDFKRKENTAVLKAAVS